MGCRRQPRIPIIIPANLCGMDAKGRAFVDRVRLVNMSRDGVHLEDVSCGVKIGDMVALRCDDTTRRFRVIWDQPGNNGRQIGLAAAGPLPSALEKWLPLSAPDEYVRPRGDQRRGFIRYECELPAQIRFRGDEAPMWVTACDISEGGCCLQIQHAVTPHTEVTVGMWLEGERVWLHGVITHSLYGCGAGIKFARVQQSVKHKLAYLLASSDKEVTDRRESTVELNQIYAAYTATSE